MGVDRWRLISHAGSRKVLIELAKMRTNKEIAQKLHITKSGVEYHVSNILGKLQVKNRRQAVRKALRLGLLTPNQIGNENKP